MSTKNILKLMHVFAWLALVGLCIKTGTIIVNYFISIKNPGIALNLFGGINLTEYYSYNFYQYTLIVGYKVLFFALEAYIAYLLVLLLGKIDVKNPFNSFVANLMKKTSKSIFLLWIFAMIHNTHMQYIAKKEGFEMDLFSSDFVFLAAILFVFTQIIKQGIEIKTENELTI